MTLMYIHKLSTPGTVSQSVLCELLTVWGRDGLDKHLRHLQVRPCFVFHYVFVCMVVIGSLL